MPLPKTPHATVLRSIYTHATVADLLALGDKVYAAGSVAAEVAASLTAKNALVDLKTAIDALRATFTSRVALELAYKASVKAEQKTVTAAKAGMGTYLTVVDHLANGDQTVINHAGLEARPDRAKLPLDKPGKLSSKPGKHATEAIVRWGIGPGASAYAIEVNFTPLVAGAWTAITSGRSRVRVIKAPAPGAQFLVRVASIGANAVSDWTDPVMATAL